jgi:hypothetical protein
MSGKADPASSLLGHPALTFYGGGSSYPLGATFGDVWTTAHHGVAPRNATHIVGAHGDPHFASPEAPYSTDADDERASASTCVYHFAHLAAVRHEAASLARFAQHVDYATFHLCAALDTPDMRRAWSGARGVRMRRAHRTWFGALADGAFDRYRSLRRILVLQWPEAKEASPLRHLALIQLCDLTPARSQLQALIQFDEPRARGELVRHLDLVTEQLELTVKLAEELADEDRKKDEAEAGATGTLERASAVEDALLAKGGDALSLTQAAARLGTSRQNLHRRIMTGSALGVMRGRELVVPSAQFVESDKGVAIVPHLKAVLAPFTQAEAGAWAALQFLVEPDPNLGAAPLAMLRAGEHERVVAAARSYLALDEG